jgi:hypothetical protein
MSWVAGKRPLQHSTGGPRCAADDMMQVAVGTLQEQKTQQLCLQLSLLVIGTKAHRAC